MNRAVYARLRAPIEVLLAAWSINVYICSRRIIPQCMRAHPHGLSTLNNIYIGPDVISPKNSKLVPLTYVCLHKTALNDGINHDCVCIEQSHHRSMFSHSLTQFTQPTIYVNVFPPPSQHDQLASCPNTEPKHWPWTHDRMLLPQVIRALTSNSLGLRLSTLS